MPSVIQVPATVQASAKPGTAPINYTVQPSSFAVPFGANVLPFLHPSVRSQRAASNLIANVPHGLRDLKAWVLWKKGKVRPLDKPDGTTKLKFDKVPYYVSGGKRHGTQGSAVDRAKLVTFDVALAAFGQRRLRRPGFGNAG